MAAKATIGRQNKLVRGMKLRQKMRFNHEERINFLYQSVIHHHSLNSIVDDTGVKYTTVYTILKEYQEHGRTNRQLNYQEKVNRLNLRANRNFNML